LGLSCGLEEGALPPNPRSFSHCGKLRWDQPGERARSPGRLGTGRGLPGRLISQLASPAAQVALPQSLILPGLGREFKTIDGCRPEPSVIRMSRKATGFHRAASSWRLHASQARACSSFSSRARRMASADPPACPAASRSRWRCAGARCRNARGTGRRRDGHPPGRAASSGGSPPLSRCGESAPVSRCSAGSAAR
jgi:hypothetical protein